VVVSNWGGIVAETVAEAALGMIIAALRRTQEFGDLMHRQKGWEWAPNRTLSLFDRRVGIHGFGLVVRRLLPLLKSFRCSVMIYAAGVPETWFAECKVRKASMLEELFDWSDVVVEAEALTPSNYGIINEKLLRRLHPGDVFVNIARGGLVDEAALAAVAADSEIRVALDVFQEEPLSPTSPLRGMSHVLLTPHVAGPTEDRYPLCGEQALNNLERYLRGDCVESEVTLSVYDRST
jgi:phosphoglycerate dehydrogenase-like enzyme